MNGTDFLTLPSKFQEPLTFNKSNETKTCPTVLLDRGNISSRSTCPWYNVPIRNEDLYPSNWTETECICEKCIDFDNKFSCEAVYMTAFFLKRSKCIDGLYVYEAYHMQIKTGCTCARKRSYKNDK